MRTPIKRLKLRMQIEQGYYFVALQSSHNTQIIGHSHIHVIREEWT